MGDMADVAREQEELFRLRSERMAKNTIVRPTKPIPGKNGAPLKVPPKKIPAAKGRSGPVQSNVNTTTTGLQLSTEFSEPLTDLAQYAILLYGEIKIGKTSLASQFDNTTFLMFEPGGRALRLRQNPVNSWEDARGYLSLLEEDARQPEPQFGTVIVDTEDIAYEQCFDWVCRMNGFTHPQDEGDNSSRAWKAIRNEFAHWHERLLRLNKGVILISHAKERRLTRRDGSTYDGLTPSLTGQASGVILPLMDIIAYYGYYGSERSLVIRGDDFVTAGCRLEENFLTPDGVPVKSISMGANSGEAHANFIAGFNNELDVTGNIPRIKQKQRKY